MIDITGLVVLLLFYAVILVVGIVAGRRVKLGNGQQIELSMVAGRKLGKVVGIFTMTATVVGGGFLNGTAESVGTSGLIWTLTPYCIWLGLIIGGLVYAGRMRDMCYVTMLDPFQQQYGNVVTFFIYLASLCGDVFWMASILSALGTSVSVIVDLDIGIAVVSSAAVTVIYTLVGQMISVAYTDIVELVFIALGLVTSLPFILTNENSGDIQKTSSIWLGTLPEETASVWADLFIAMTLGTIPWQSYFQRVLSVKTSRDAQIFSIIAAFASLLLAVPAVLIGAVGVSANWNATSLGASPLDIGQASILLPHVIHEFSPPAVALLGLAAICAAVMSSMDSSVLGSSSMFTHNIFKNIFYPKAGDRLLLWVHRFSVVIIGTISTVISLVSMQTIFGMFVMAADIVFVNVLPQLTCALFVKPSNAYGALTGYLLGLVLRIGAGEYYLSLPAFIKYPFYNEEMGEQLFPFRTFLFLLSMFTIVMVSLLTNWLFSRLPGQLDILGVMDRRALTDNNTPVVLSKFKHKEIDLQM